MNLDVNPTMNVSAKSVKNVTKESVPQGSVPQESLAKVSVATKSITKESVAKKSVVIIGAGPIGCYAGFLLAKQGYAVSIYENHPQIGLPIQCTGIITAADLDEFGFPLKSFLVNTINTIEVYAPGKKLSVKQKDYIVCRTKFDNFFANLARKAGAKIFVNHSFMRKEGSALVIKDTVHYVEKRIVSDIVIGADGPLSPTAKAYGFYHPERKNYYGVQAVVEGTFEPGTIKTYFGNDVCPGLFAWVCPESSTTARVGLAALRNSRHYFDKFMKEQGFTAKEMQAGTIPVYHPAQKLLKDNCYLFWDVAGCGKATSLGGLIPGLRQAAILADCISQGKNYEKEIRKVQKRMEMHLFIQRVVNTFSDKDLGLFVGYINQPRIQRILEKYTRENSVAIVIHSIIREPRLVLLASKTFLKDPGMLRLVTAFF